MSLLKEIFTEELTEYYKQNKSEITSELLESLRAHGNEGKQIALDILDLEKDSESYYLDAFDNRISYKKNPTLKGPNVKLKLSPIHIEEILKCKEDIFYYLSNYCKIITPKGVNFPDIRPYQLDFLNTILPDETESIVGLMPRQAGKSVTVGIYFSWLTLFETDVNIGIAAQKHSLAKEVLNKVKEIFLNIPIWLTPGVKSWNRLSVEFENGVRIMSDTASSTSFRGFTMSYTLTDEAAYINGLDNGVPRFEAYLDSMLPSQSGLSKKKNLYISTANGMNSFHSLYKGAEVKDETIETVQVSGGTRILLKNGTIVSVEEYYKGVKKLC